MSLDDFDFGEACTVMLPFRLGRVEPTKHVGIKILVLGLEPLDLKGSSLFHQSILRVIHGSASPKPKSSMPTLILPKKKKFIIDCLGQHFVKHVAWKELNSLSIPKKKFSIQYSLGRQEAITFLQTFILEMGVEMDHDIQNITH